MRCPAASGSASASRARSCSSPTCCSPTSRPRRSIPKTSVEIMELLAQLAGERGIPVIVNMHDVELARRFADRIVGMSGGAVVYRRPAGRARPTRISKHIYGGEDWLRMKAAPQSAAPARRRLPRRTGLPRLGWALLAALRRLRRLAARTSRGSASRPGSSTARASSAACSRRISSAGELLLDGPRREPADRRARVGARHRSSRCPFGLARARAT